MYYIGSTPGLSTLLQVPRWPSPGPGPASQLASTKLRNVTAVACKHQPSTLLHAHVLSLVLLEASLRTGSGTRYLGYPPHAHTRLAAFCPRPPLALSPIGTLASPTPVRMVAFV
ncbi:predicted protein [Plenodomus lingam JN3]|uniref:Predicted protein n=1 Tax=Leptosphaeria maculans (strain JN3 / isolate v23.1.3 / race Av1-4-5-6-7-8) TaxID=985895 RepID=E4ZMA2_LEPMJ|nr:predicted protein [Plenodomus lingam JN3]CBX92451.1 predicted protein [Plenodomus lingam JN3]